MRVFYTTVDYETSFGGLHLLAGQNWSLATLNSKGITPAQRGAARRSSTPSTSPGFVFTRQPQVRVTVDFNNTLWFAASVENPQTTYFNNGKYLPTVPASSRSASSPTRRRARASTAPTRCRSTAIPTPSPRSPTSKNIGGGHQFHVEGFGILRDFYCPGEPGLGPLQHRRRSAAASAAGMTCGLFPPLLDMQASAA